MGDGEEGHFGGAIHEWKHVEFSIFIIKFSSIYTFQNQGYLKYSPPIKYYNAQLTTILFGLQSLRNSTYY